MLQPREDAALGWKGQRMSPGWGLWPIEGRTCRGRPSLAPGPAPPGSGLGSGSGRWGGGLQEVRLHVHGAVGLLTASEVLILSILGTLAILWSQFGLGWWVVASRFFENKVVLSTKIFVVFVVLGGARPVSGIRRRLLLLRTDQRSTARHGLLLPLPASTGSAPGTDSRPWCAMTHFLVRSGR